MGRAPGRDRRRRSRQSHEERACVLVDQPVREQAQLDYCHSAPLVGAESDLLAIGALRAVGRLGEGDLDPRVGEHGQAADLGAGDAPHDRDGPAPGGEPPGDGPGRQDGRVGWCANHWCAGDHDIEHAACARRTGAAGEEPELHHDRRLGMVRAETDAFAIRALRAVGQLGEGDLHTVGPTLGITQDSQPARRCATDLADGCGLAALGGKGAWQRPHGKDCRRRQDERGCRNGVAVAACGRPTRRRGSGARAGQGHDCRQRRGHSYA